MSFIELFCGPSKKTQTLSALVKTSICPAIILPTVGQQKFSLEEERAKAYYKRKRIETEECEKYMDGLHNHGRSWKPY